MCIRDRGGTRLREEYGKKIDLTPLAETWECSVHPDGPSYVANGTYKEKTLAEVLKEMCIRDSFSPGQQNARQKKH